MHQLRSKGLPTPILMLTAAKHDRVAHYLVKPFALLN